MSDPNATMSSSLPVLAFVVPAVGGALVFLGRRYGRPFAQSIALVTSGFVAVVGLLMLPPVLSGKALTSWGEEFRVDALSALLVAAIGCIGLLTAVYSVRYVAQPELVSRVGEHSSERRMPVFYGLFLWFLASMVWGCVTNNIIMLYVAVEATTLASGLLVAFYWDRRALEAGYKYLMLLTIGITFALFGCVVIYASAAATGQLVGSQALLISHVRGVAHLIPARTASIAVAFLVIGFGTKAGIAPFHPWLPDAHAEAPTPISVLLSGVMIKMAAYALARTVSMFYPSLPQVTIFLVALGVFTMVLGVLAAFPQQDLKRLLAYSSVSQIGYVVVGIGLGTYLGCYGGLFHLLNHAIIKALLFMCVGAIIYATGARRIADLGGLSRRMPITSVCFFVGVLAIAGFPPLNGFMSKITVYLALARSGLWWAAVAAVLVGVLTMVVMMRAAVAVFWRPRLAGDVEREIHDVPAGMWAPMLVLAAACVVLGIFPQLTYPLLDQAATVLATVGR